MAKEPLPTKKYVLDLNEDEVVILQYLVGTAASPYAGDPLKDIYEMDHAPFDDKEDGDLSREPYDALQTLCRKVAAKGDE